MYKRYLWWGWNIVKGLQHWTLHKNLDLPRTQDSGHNRWHKNHSEFRGKEYEWSGRHWGSDWNHAALQRDGPGRTIAWYSSGMTWSWHRLPLSILHSWLINHDTICFWAQIRPRISCITMLQAVSGNQIESALKWNLLIPIRVKWA